MLFENASIGKILSSIVAIGGGSCASFAYRNEISSGLKKLFSLKEEKINKKTKTIEGDDYFFVVKTDEQADLEATEDLYVESTPQTRNFKCVLSKETDKFDETCDIFELTPKNNENKLIGLKEIENAKKATKEKIKTDVFFKLKLKKSSINIQELDGSKKIDLISTVTGKESKKYGTFSVLYKIDGNKVTGKTNLLIGKAKDIQTATDITDTNCGFENMKDDEKEVCEIYSFPSQPDASEVYKDLVFAPIKITNPISLSSFKAGDLFLIDLKNKKIDISSLSSKTLIVYEKKVNPEIIFKFDFVVPLISDTTDFSKSNTTFFLI